MFETVDELRFRLAGPGDADAIAALHADSWRRHYRGAYADTFLDGDVTGYLGSLWAKRLAARDPRTRTILAERDGAERHGALAGFAHTALGESPEWGALLDNLHVAYGRKRQGLGRRLVALTARAVIDAAPGSGLYLWVFDQNAAARAFYAALGGESVERVTVKSLGGDASRLNGTPRCWRIAWRDPARLLADAAAGPVADAVAGGESSD
jgi:ribosomal protein S18 acetylase RimI-like enzyme